jgi:uncharacterized ion transporter superfamily protein YfcC
MRSETSRTTALALLTLILWSAVFSVLLVEWWTTGVALRWFEIGLPVSMIAYSWIRIRSSALRSPSLKVPDYLFPSAGLLMLLGVTRNFLVG